MIYIQQNIDYSTWRGAGLVHISSSKQASVYGMNVCDFGRTRLGPMVFLSLSPTAHNHSLHYAASLFEPDCLSYFVRVARRSKRFAADSVFPGRWRNLTPHPEAGFLQFSSIPSAQGDKENKTNASGTVKQQCFEVIKQHKCLYGVWRSLPFPLLRTSNRLFRNPSGTFGWDRVEETPGTTSGGSRHK